MTCPVVFPKMSFLERGWKPAQISSLLFANDLAIFLHTKNGLQEKPDFLEKYCRQWDLGLNLKKTKVIKFNKQGNTIKKLSFIIGENKLKLQANISI